MSTIWPRCHSGHDAGRGADMGTGAGAVPVNLQSRVSFTPLCIIHLSLLKTLILA